VVRAGRRHINDPDAVGEHLNAFGAQPVKTGEPLRFNWNTPFILSSHNLTDSTFRAFDSQTGEMLWQLPLAASVYATPMTYKDPKGQEFIVVAAGGGGFFPGPLGDELIAVALPAKP